MSSFQAPSASQVRQNRQIIEELQEQKKRLHAGPAAAGSGSGGGSSGSGLPARSGEAVSKQQFLQPTDSFGTYLKLESAYGNNIIPVLPRLPPPTAAAGSGSSGSGVPARPGEAVSKQQLPTDSFGTYLKQESAYGNNIIPVLPKLPPPAAAAGSGSGSGGGGSGSGMPARPTEAVSKQQFLQPTDSFGTYLKQESAYGNSIIPVLPRLPPPVAVHDEKAG